MTSNNSIKKCRP